MDAFYSGRPALRRAVFRLAATRKKEFLKAKSFSRRLRKRQTHDFSGDWGAKEKQFIGIDLSQAVESAFQATRHLPNAHIVQADIYKLPFKRAFDYAFSVGVLHHTPDPKKAFLSLASKVKKGGAISAWIYGEENNEWIINYINPVRMGFTSKINQPTLYQLSKLPTLGVFLASKLIYKPLNKTAQPLARRLFYNDYLNHLGPFGCANAQLVLTIGRDGVLHLA